jgi:peptidoglycan glycosyltransferase
MNTPLRRLALVVGVLFASLLAGATWVQFIDAGSLQARPGNARTLYKEFGRERGPLVVAGEPVAESKPVDDAYKYLRSYPGGRMYSPITGYYSIVYGATGMESADGDLLAGTADQLFYRRIGDLLTGGEPQGAAVELTIDPKAQQEAWKALGDQHGAVVALNPKTGDILALVSKPAFDPDLLAGHDVREVRAARAQLLKDPDEPLSNRAIAGDQYPPGSVFKLVTAAAALESGRWTKESQISGPARLDLPQTTATLPNDFSGACGPNGKISLANALKISCNTAFGSLGLALGDDALREQAQKFGFGEDLRIPLAVTPSRFPAQADPPQTAQSAIGQFDVRVTPMQMAMVSATIANGGVLVRPNLVEKVRSQDDLEVIEQPRPEEIRRAISRGTAEQLTSMMEGVVQGGTGTRAQISGVRVAGKTGTAQQGPGRPPHAWFTAFAPADDPQVAIAVVVEDGGGLGDAASGGRLAAPIARQVIEAVLGR